MNDSDLERRLRGLYARDSAGVTDGAEDRILGALTTRPAARARTFFLPTAATAAFLVAVAVIAFALHAMRQNASQPQPTPSCPVPSATPSAAPITPPVSILSILMVTPSVGWANAVARAADGSAIGLTLRTVDGGSHWQNVTPPGSGSAGGALALDANNAWSLAPQSGDCVSVRHTRDGGKHWAAVPLPVHHLSGGGISFVNGHRGWLLLGNGFSNAASASYSEAATLWATDDGGATWHVVSMTDASGHGGIPYRGDKVGLTFRDDRTGWLAVSTYPTPELFVTHDGGRTWNSVRLTWPREADVAGAGITAPRFFTPADGEFYVNGIKAIVFTTHDAGASWQAHVAPDGGTVFFLDAATGWLLKADVNGATLYRTEDGGRTWQSSDLSTENVRGGVTIDFATRELGFVTLYEPTSGGYVLLKTVDGGVTWDQVHVVVS